ncbi:hypothetical protein Hypma_009687 [Hypsizygus marmoreus]|uniref:Uncharacterized protein n=1 Tax=Hypsizygus marmoreus TaxID=39966 RepID=A0A369JPF9_HYPMA|nr:hypothetical protein Hypma_009687 [Hypsizygus marmoreus]
MSTISTANIDPHIMNGDLHLMFTAQRVNNQHPRLMTAFDHQHLGRRSLGQRRAVYIGKACLMSHLVPLLFYDIPRGRTPSVDDMHVENWLDSLRTLPPWVDLESHRTKLTFVYYQGRLLLLKNPYVIYHASNTDYPGQRNRRVSDLIGQDTVEWEGNMIVVKLNSEEEVVDLEDQDIPFVERLCYSRGGPSIVNESDDIHGVDQNHTKHEKSKDNITSRPLHGYVISMTVIITLACVKGEGQPVSVSITIIMKILGDASTYAACPVSIPFSALETPYTNPRLHRGSQTFPSGSAVSRAFAIDEVSVAILGHGSPSTLASFRSVNKDSNGAVQSMLTTHVLSAVTGFFEIAELPELWAAMKQTNSVIGGSVALTVITPLNVTPNNINLYCPAGETTTWIELLVRLGYAEEEKCPITHNCVQSAISHTRWKRSINGCSTTVLLTESSMPSVMPLVLSAKSTTSMSMITPTFLYSMYSRLTSLKRAVSGAYSPDDEGAKKHEKWGINLKRSSEEMDITCGLACPAARRTWPGDSGIGRLRWASREDEEGTSEKYDRPYAWRLGNQCKSYHCGA